jgi:hypothetical protein
LGPVGILAPPLRRNSWRFHIDGRQGQHRPSSESPSPSPQRSAFIPAFSPGRRRRDAPASASRTSRCSILEGKPLSRNVFHSLSGRIGKRRVFAPNKHRTHDPFSSRRPFEISSHHRPSGQSKRHRSYRVFIQVKKIIIIMTASRRLDSHKTRVHQRQHHKNSKSCE